MAMNDPLNPQSANLSPSPLQGRGMSTMGVGGPPSVAPTAPGISPPSLTGGRLLSGSGSLPAKGMGPGQSSGPVIGGGKPAAPITKEEQAQIEKDAHRMVTRGMELLYSPETKDQVVSALKDSTNLVQGVATEGKAIIQKLDSVTAKEGIRLHEMSKVIAGKDIIEEIALIAKVAGVGELEEDDKLLAYSVSIQDYLKEEIAEGRQNPDEVQAAMKTLLERLPKEELEKANMTVKTLAKTAEKWKDRDPMMAGRNAGLGEVA